MTPIKKIARRQVNSLDLKVNAKIILLNLQRIIFKYYLPDFRFIV
jgi:hypothetical protein